MTDEQLRLILHDVRARLGPDAPGWTDRNDSDPGVTLVQMFGWIAESLFVRGRVHPAILTEAAKAGERLSRLGRAQRSSAGEPLTRLHYFHGRLLSAEDLQVEQDYFRNRLRRHNRLFIGSGIVEGLDVYATHDDDGAPAIVVQPGFALDPWGNEIVLGECRTHPVGTASDHLLVVLRAIDRPTVPVPLDRPTGVIEHARLVEDAALDVAASAPDTSGLVIARLVRDGARVRLDTGFTPARIPAARAQASP